MTHDEILKKMLDALGPKVTTKDFAIAIAEQYAESVAAAAKAEALALHQAGTEAAEDAARLRKVLKTFLPVLKCYHLVFGTERGAANLKYVEDLLGK